MAHASALNPLDIFIETFNLNPADESTDLVSQRVQTIANKAFTQTMDREGNRLEGDYRRFWFRRNVIQINKNGQANGTVGFEYHFPEHKQVYRNSNGELELFIGAAFSGYNIFDSKKNALGHLKFHKKEQTLKLLDKNQNPIFTTTYRNGAWMTQIQQKNVLSENQIHALISTYFKDKNMGFFEANYVRILGSVAVVAVAALVTLNGS
jgi:hypothetical protein